MHWGPYEVFSVISGIIVVLAALFIPGESPKDRFGGVIVGGAMAAYGFYVANQTSGTYYFPVAIFIVPVLTLLYLIAAVVQRSGGSSSGGSQQ
ncbi:MAG: hypothetical protein ACJ786_41795 [Catenulispora sp.]